MFPRRLKDLLTDAEVAIGGDLDEEERYISPTILVNVKETHQIMQDEIFGPILPIVTVDSPTEAMNFITERYFSSSIVIYSNICLACSD